jgi:hypothetical protein
MYGKSGLPGIGMKTGAVAVVRLAEAEALPAAAAVPDELSSLGGGGGLLTATL